MTDNTPQIHVPVLPKIRFRVVEVWLKQPYGKRYALVSQGGVVWINGHSFGIMPEERYYDIAYFPTEEAAWKQAPIEGWEILPPDTPLWRVLLYEPGVRSGIGYWDYYSQVEPNLTTIPIIIEGLTELVMIPDINRFTKYEVMRV